MDGCGMDAIFAILDYADYNTRVISDLIKNPSVIYHKRYMDNSSRSANILYKIRTIPERCFGSWYAEREFSQLFGNRTFNDGEYPVLIVYECNLLAQNIRLLKGLKQGFPKLKMVLVVTNIIGAAGSPDSHINEQRKVFDLIVTFSENDAEQYKLAHYEGMYSSLDIEGVRRKDDEYEYDLYFCGRDKGRIQCLVAVAENLRRNRVSFRFDIIGDIGPKVEGFFYQNNLIQNEEMLRRASRAKTVLEIMADPSNKGSSLRPYEAFALGTKLLSNNRFLGEKPWFNPKQISIFEDHDKIDINFIRTPLKEEDAQDISTLSPVRFLEFLVSELNLQIDESKITGC